MSRGLSGRVPRVRRARAGAMWILLAISGKLSWTTLAKFLAVLDSCYQELCPRSLMSNTSASHLLISLCQASHRATKYGWVSATLINSTQLHGVFCPQKSSASVPIHLGHVVRALASLVHDLTPPCSLASSFFDLRFLLHRPSPLRHRLLLLHLPFIVLSLPLISCNPSPSIPSPTLSSSSPSNPVDLALAFVFFTGAEVALLSLPPPVPLALPFAVVFFLGGVATAPIGKPCSFSRFFIRLRNRQLLFVCKYQDQGCSLCLSRKGRTKQTRFKR